MKRFPSMKTVLLCGFAAALVAISIPANPHPSAHRLTGAIATIGNGTDNAANGQTPTQPTNNSTGRPPGATGGQNNTTPPGATGGQNSTTPGAGSANNNNSASIGQGTGRAPHGPASWGYTQRKTAELRVRVIDGRSRQPISNAEVVVIETEQRLRTDANGYTPWFSAPVFRNPRYRPMVAELHGQLGVIVYKNGYRDSIHLGIRMHEGIRQQTTVWMYKIGPGDRRIEPVLYQEPYHHIWLIQLADKFRQKSQIGEGPERP
ncbi:hypothetical protein AAC03nite_14750 [Alicyclobacillus acidoterrestris]|nr:hypothetical protein AAC03nite_14750 [Alicyclobacillus acidoterrestris]